MDVTNKIPLDGEVYALSSEPYSIRAEFVETEGTEGAEARIAWRLYDRHDRGILLTEEAINTLCTLTENYLSDRHDR